MTDQITATHADAPQQDTGLACLAIVGRFHGIPVDPNQLRHDFAKLRERFVAGDLVRAARRLGLSDEWLHKLEIASPNQQSH